MKLLSGRITNGSVPNPDLSNWPDLSFQIKSTNGQWVDIAVSPDTYWQLDGDGVGNAVFRIDSTTSEDGQPPLYLLGLPLMNNYLCVFDRANDRIRLADPWWPTWWDYRGHG